MVLSTFNQTYQSLNLAKSTTRGSLSADNCSANQILHLLWKRVLLLCSHLYSTGPSLSYVNPVHIHIPSFTILRLNVIPPSTRKSSKWSLSFFCLTKMLQAFSMFLSPPLSLSCMLHAPPVLPSLFYRRNNTAVRKVTYSKTYDIHIIILYLHLGNLEHVKGFLSINTSLDVCTISDTQNVQTMLPPRLQSSRTSRYLE